MYDTAEKCAGEATGGAFDWISYSTCIHTEEGDNLTIESCGDGQYTVNAYFDTSCVGRSNQVTVDLPVCKVNEDSLDSNELSTYNYQTYVCN